MPQQLRFSAGLPNATFDIHRRRALVPFLEATEFLEGHIVAVAVTKRLSRMSTGTQTMDLWKRLHGLQAKWDAKNLRADDQSSPLLLDVLGGMVFVWDARTMAYRRGQHRCKPRKT